MCSTEYATIDAHGDNASSFDYEIVDVNTPQLNTALLDDDSGFIYEIHTCPSVNTVKTEEMLGHVDPSKLNSWPEDECPFCGFFHKNPSLLDLYSYCENCLSQTRNPAHLRKRVANTVQNPKLEVLIASYGDISDASKAFDVTEICRKIVNDSEDKDRLCIRKACKLEELFGRDPSPGNPKHLRVRYRINRKHGFLSLKVQPDNHLNKPLVFVSPAERLLTIISGTYGHPAGLSKSGRMEYDITENLQGIADLNGGSYFVINTNETLSDLFSDPCVGYVKDVKIYYDISGRMCTKIFPEAREGRLKRDCVVVADAVVAPMVQVESASYGITEKGKREYIHSLAKKISLCDAIEHRRKIGMPAKADEVALLRSKPKLLEQLKLMQATSPVSTDIRDKLQEYADSQGGLALVLKKETFDPNREFGNISPNCAKLIEATVFCQGHDCNAMTSSDEITIFGFPKNVLMQQRMHMTVQVLDDEDGKGVLTTDFEVRSSPSMPLLQIERALYESVTDRKKSADITPQLQAFVKGRTLFISKTANLNMMFGDPCPGVRKQLAVFYVVRGYKGCVRVRERDNKLMAKIELGYPPTPPPDV